MGGMIANLSARQYGFEAPGPTAIYIAVVMLTLAWTSVGLRMWTRVVLIKNIGMDDMAIFITLVRARPQCLATYHRLG